MTSEVLKWLESLSIKISPEYLHIRLESHPDYPSLAAIQDTLEELGIEAGAYSGTREDLSKENRPFLAHLNTNGGEVLFFKNLAETENKVRDFVKLWSGNVMFVDRAPDGKLHHEEHSKHYQAELRDKLFIQIAVILFPITMLGLATIQEAYTLFPLSVINLLGLYFSWLIAQKEFGISNSLSDKICRMAKHSRCESVLFSRGAKLLSWFTWADVGIVYFSASSLYLLFVLVSGKWEAMQLFYLISLGSFVFPFYSIYYQWRTVKQWCMLCLAVVLALVLNGIAGAFLLQPLTGTTGTILSFLPVFILISFLALSVWQLFKSVYRKSLSAVFDKINFTRMKRNPRIFNALLQKQEADPANLPETEEPIRFGNTEAPFQIVIACSPSCGPCMKAHQAIEELFEKYPGRLNIGIRFALYDEDENNKKLQSVTAILRAARKDPFHAVRDWYHLLDIDKFGQSYQLNGMPVDKDVEKFRVWTAAKGITATPTFFINGRELPDLYSWKDLTEILELEMKNTLGHYS